MAKKESHQILHTFINRHGALETRVNCGFVGATDEEAKATFNDHVHLANYAWTEGKTWNGTPVRITGIVLVDANENVLAQWTHVPEMEVAA